MMHVSLRGGRALVVIVAWTFAAARAGAQALPAGCNAKIANATRPNADEPYKARGAAARWCEGFFSEQIGNSQLRLQSFTTRVSPLDTAFTKRGDSLIVEWRAPSATVVRLSARQASDPNRPYYQLDAEATTGADGTGRWSWPTALLRRYDMWPVTSFSPRGAAMPARVSVQAAASLRNAGTMDSIYIPVRIVQPKETAAPSMQLDVTMIAPERVELKYIVLTRLLEREATTRVAMAPRCPAPQGGEIGGALVRITVCMPAHAVTGTYLLTVGDERPKTVPFYYMAPKRAP